MNRVDFLRAYGEARYGQEWQSAVARLLGELHPEGARDTIDPSLVRKWLRNARPVPDWVPTALAAMAEREADALTQEAGALAHRAKTLRELATATIEDVIMTGDNSLYRFGQALGTNSGPAAEAMFFAALDAAETAAVSLHQTDRESLVHAVAGTWDQQAMRPAGADLHGLAEQFTGDIWFGMLDGRPPVLKRRKLMAAIVTGAAKRSGRAP